MATPTGHSEFASARFFSKLNDQEHDVEGPPSTPPARTFILPVRAAHATLPQSEVDHDGRARNGFVVGLRQRLLKGYSNEEGVGGSARRKSSVEIQSGSLDASFRQLPGELHLIILEHLSLPDILSMRLVSRPWHCLVTHFSTPIARFHLRHSIPLYAHCLYPSPPDESQLFHHLISLWSRLHTASHMTNLTIDWVNTEIFLRRTPAQKKEFAAQTERMRRRLIPLLFVIFHFFEQYRLLHLHYIANNPGHGLCWEPYTINPIELQILSQYPPKMLLRVHEVFPLVISTFCRQLRPPTYAGTIERGIRGYLGEKVSDQAIASILCVGGPAEMVRLWNIEGYNHRRSAVDTWFTGLLQPPPAPVLSTTGLSSTIAPTTTATSTSQIQNPNQSTKQKHKFLTRLTRKKSLASVPIPAQVPSAPSIELLPPRPMPQLSMAQNRLLLADIPPLQHIWAVTAEAVIMQRRIVDKPEDILRNERLLYSLIGEVGVDDEDALWFGESVARQWHSGADDADRMDIDG